MKLKFKVISADQADLDDLRKFHSDTEISCYITPNGYYVVATAYVVPERYKETLLTVEDYIRHAINCSFPIANGYSKGWPTVKLSPQWFKKE